MGSVQWPTRGSTLHQRESPPLQPHNLSSACLLPSGSKDSHITALSQHHLVNGQRVKCPDPIDPVVQRPPTGVTKQKDGGCIGHAKLYNEAITEGVKGVCVCVCVS